MKITIITVCFNSELTIEDTILSVLEQDYDDLEYIVIDGGSKDKTLNIVGKYSSRINRIISEPDEGIYFALNKGIALASGAVIGILHSDDIYASRNILATVNKTFEDNGVEAVYGDLQYVAKEDSKNIRRIWIAGPYKTGSFLRGWMPPHPTFFVLKSCYEKYGVFNTLFHSAADYELMLRLVHKNHIKIGYIPQILVLMRVGGKSNVSVTNRLQANQEDRLAWKVNNIKPGLFTLTLKPLSKLRQFFPRIF